MVFDKSKLPEGVRLWLEEAEQRWQQKLLLQAQREEEMKKSSQLYQARLAREQRERESIQHFMEESDAFCFDPTGKIPIQVLYDLYSRWCEEQFFTPKALRTFSGYLKQNAADYHIIPTNFRWEGKHIRGLRGMRLIQK